MRLTFKHYIRQFFYNENFSSVYLENLYIKQSYDNFFEIVKFALYGTCSLKSITIKNNSTVQWINKELINHGKQLKDLY